MSSSEKNFLTIRQVQSLLQTSFAPILTSDLVYLINYSENWICSGNFYSDLSHLTDLDFWESIRGYGEGIYPYVPDPQWDPPGYQAGISGNGVLLLKKVAGLETDIEMFLAIILPNEQFQDNFVVDQSENIVITDQDGWILSHSDQSQIGKNFAAMEEKFASGATGGFTYLDDMLVTIDHDIRGWNYYYFSPAKTALAELTRIRTLTITMMVVILILNTLFAWSGSKMLYRPISLLLLALQNKKKPSIQKGFQEFMFIEKKMDDMITTNLDYKNKIAIQTDYLNDYFLYRLLFDEKEAPEAVQYLQAQSPIQDNSCFCILTIDIDYVNPNYFKEQDSALISFAIGNILHELFDKPGFKTVVYNDGQYYILVMAKENDQLFRLTLESQANTILHALREYLGVVVSVGIGRICTDISELHCSMLESTAAIKYRMGNQEGSILFYQQRVPQAACPPSVQEDRTTILTMLNLHECENLTFLLDRYIDHLYKACPSHDAFQMEIVQFFIEIYKAIHNKCPLPEDPIGLQKSLLESLLKINTISKIKSFFHLRLIMPYEESIHNNHGSSFKMELEKYIYQNIYHDLSLENCASYFNYSPGHLSKLIKKYLGSSFSDYVGELKIQIAKKLLTETNMSIQDIAAKLNHNNSQNFIRNYKKITGMTPGKYRESFRQN